MPDKKTYAGLRDYALTKYTVDMNQFSSRRRLPTHSLKELTCHPSELLPLENIKKLKPKDPHLYAAYSDVGAVAETRALYKIKRKKNPTAPVRPSAPSYKPSARRDDTTVKGLDEFLYVLTDLPRAVRTKKVYGLNGMLRTVRYRETPRVIARGETTGRLYIAPAWWLWRITGTFEQSPYIGGGKIAERYRWQYHKDTPEPPAWYSYDPESEDTYTYSGFLMDLPESLPPSKLLECKAWYWQLPAKSAREFSISSLSIKWTKPQIGSPLAIISLTYKGNDYQIPVYLSPKHELYVKVKSREIAAFLCRYTVAKLQG